MISTSPTMRILVATESARPPPLAPALTAVGGIGAASQAIMPYCALRPASTEPRRVRVSLEAAPRRRRHGTAPSIADHQGHPGSTTRFFLPFRFTETRRAPTSHSGIGEETYTIQLRWPRRTGAFVCGVNGHSGGPQSDPCRWNSTSVVANLGRAGTAAAAAAATRVSWPCRWQIPCSCWTAVPGKRGSTPVPAARLRKARPASMHWSPPHPSVDASTAAHCLRIRSSITGAMAR